MLTVADYVREAKSALGNPRMSDREMGEKLGLSGPMISSARYGNMSDPLALKIAAIIKRDPGEVLLVARAQREKDQAVKAALMAYAGKVLGRLSATATAALMGVALATGLLLQPREAGAGLAEREG